VTKIQDPRPGVAVIGVVAALDYSPWDRTLFVGSSLSLSSGPARQFLQHSRSIVGADLRSRIILPFNGLVHAIPITRLRTFSRPTSALFPDQIQLDLGLPSLVVMGVLGLMAWSFSACGVSPELAVLSDTKTKEKKANSGIVPAVWRCWGARPSACAGLFLVGGLKLTSLEIRHGDRLPAS